MCDYLRTDMGIEAWLYGATIDCAAPALRKGHIRKGPGRDSLARVTPNEWTLVKNRQRKGTEQKRSKSRGAKRQLQMGMEKRLWVTQLVKKNRSKKQQHR
jgi:hypothetical protein